MLPAQTIVSGEQPVGNRGKAGILRQESNDRAGSRGGDSLLRECNSRQDNRPFGGTLHPIRHYPGLALKKTAKFTGH
jgi:hypothetical protein